MELRTQLWLFLRAEVLSFKLALSTDEGIVDALHVTLLFSHYHIVVVD